MNILAIIPARGGSQSIPKKNIVPFAGKPLVAWTIDAAKKSKYINKIIVSSDDDEILRIAEHFGAESLKRPKELATNAAPFEPLIFHTLDSLQNVSGYIPEIFIYLQPTSPLRDAHDIDEAFFIFLKSDADALISVREIDNKFLKSLIVDNGYLRGAANDLYSFMNRQELPKICLPNGAIYIIKTEIFRKTKKLLSEKTIPFFMPESKSIDIDTMDDIKKLNRC